MEKEQQSPSMQCKSCKKICPVSILAHVSHSESCRGDYSDEEIKSLRISAQKKSCPLCDKKFPRKHLLNTHIAKVHEGNKQLFKCSICDKPYGTKSGLKHHFSRVHEEKSPQHKCNTCNGYFVSKAGLNTHIETVHERKNYMNARFVTKNLVKEAT